MQTGLNHGSQRRGGNCLRQTDRQTDRQRANMLSANLNLSKTGIEINIWIRSPNIFLFWRACLVTWTPTERLAWRFQKNAKLIFWKFLNISNQCVNSHWKWKKLRLIKRTKAGGGFTQRQFYRQTLFLSSASSRIFTGDLDGFYLNILSCGICLLKTFSAALEALCIPELGHLVL